ncbi:heat repeat family related protein [Cyclospora cayetanensis]|uniref:Heat repeat family related protein n=1 Tax=Cyclospora cayetanensis TaxID=88456 RepID=A0A1D3D321_9EIME|nr:heat repeat family related protein [Cyclospora cayetanensis]
MPENFPRLLRSAGCPSSFLAAICGVSLQLVCAAKGLLLTEKDREVLQHLRCCSLHADADLCVTDGFDLEDLQACSQQQERRKGEGDVLLLMNSPQPVNELHSKESPKEESSTTPRGDASSVVAALPSPRAAGVCADDEVEPQQHLPLEAATGGARELPVSAARFAAMDVTAAGAAAARDAPIDTGAWGGATEAAGGCRPRFLSETDEEFAVTLVPPPSTPRSQQGSLEATAAPAATGPAKAMQLQTSSEADAALPRVGGPPSSVLGGPPVQCTDASSRQQRRGGPCRSAAARSTVPTSRSRSSSPLRCTDFAAAAAAVATQQLRLSNDWPQCRKYSSAESTSKDRRQRRRGGSNGKKRESLSAESLGRVLLDDAGGPPAPQGGPSKGLQEPLRDTPEEFRDRTEDALDMLLGLPCSGREKDEAAAEAAAAFAAEATAAKTLEAAEQKAGLYWNSAIQQQQQQQQSRPTEAAFWSISEDRASVQDGETSPAVFREEACRGGPPEGPFASTFSPIDLDLS